MNPDDLIVIAESLAFGRVGSQRGRPRQVELRRAISTAYYALFHVLANDCADLLLGASPATRTSRAWRQAYRALDHRRVRKQCTDSRPKRVLSRFPQGIQDFADQFVKMQDMRHLADYDPHKRFARAEVSVLIDQTRVALAQLKQVDRVDRRAFAVFVLFDLRRD